MKTTCHCRVLKINGKAQQRFDRYHSVIRLADDDRLSGKEPMHLVRQTGTTLPFGTRLGPVSLPAHDIRRIYKGIAV